MPVVDLIAESDRDLVGDLLGEGHAAEKLASGMHIGTSVPATEDTLNWLAATCPDGAFGLYDEGRLKGICYAHVQGREGWLGPFSVFENEQGKGYGAMLLQKAIAHVLNKSVTTVGMEGPASPQILGFLGKVGFSPSAVVATLEVPVSSLPEQMDFWVDAYSAKSEEERKELNHQLTNFVEQGTRGADYRHIIEATEFTKAGETLVFYEEKEIVAMAIVHKGPYYMNEHDDSIHVHSLVCHVKKNVGRLDQLITAIGAYARVQEKKYLRIRILSEDDTNYQYLLSRGFRVVETRQQFTLEGCPWQRAPGYVVFANWQF